MRTGVELMFHVGSNIRRLRHAAGITTKAAAARAGMPANYWSRIEAGMQNLTMESLAKVSVGLEVDVTALLEEATAASASKEPSARRSFGRGSRTTSAGSGARASSRSSKRRTLRRSAPDTGAE